MYDEPESLPNQSQTKPSRGKGEKGRAGEGRGGEGRGGTGRGGEGRGGATKNNAQKVIWCCCLRGGGGEQQQLGGGGVLSLLEGKQQLGRGTVVVGRDPQPRYRLHLRPEAKTVAVGPGSASCTSEISRLHWGEKPDLRAACSALPG